MSQSIDEVLLGTPARGVGGDEEGEGEGDKFVRQLFESLLLGTRASNAIPDGEGQEVGSSVVFWSFVLLVVLCFHRCWRRRSCSRRRGSCRAIISAAICPDFFRCSGAVAAAEEVTACRSCSSLGSGMIHSCVYVLRLRVSTRRPLVAPLGGIWRARIGTAVHTAREPPSVPAVAVCGAVCTFDSGPVRQSRTPRVYAQSCRFDRALRPDYFFHSDVSYLF